MKNDSIEREAIMRKATNEFQIFVKPVGAACNLACGYCYYLKNKKHDSNDSELRMNESLLENYIQQHINIASEARIFFSWHGGEPTLAGLKYFRRIVELQQKYCPKDSVIVNGIQTNGTLLDEEWCRFLASENFVVGISLDGPADLHDAFRTGRRGQSSFNETLRGIQLLKEHHIRFEVLCVVNSLNVLEPLKVYNFLKDLHAEFITFLPLVEKLNDVDNRLTHRTVPAKTFGEFLCCIFDEWKSADIGNVKIQIFEEAIRTAFGLDHSLCIFKKTCGSVPVLESNGDFYSCDHFVDAEHLLGNIAEMPMIEMLEGSFQQNFLSIKLRELPEYCRQCEVLEMCHGACPKDRFIQSPDGQANLNYLCEGYRLFFNHCKPFVDQVAQVWKNQNT